MRNYMVKVKHYRNALTHYRAWERLRNMVLGDHWRNTPYQCTLVASLWGYVCQRVPAPAVDELSPNGGMTAVTLVVDDVEYYAVAYCNIMDRYVKRVGIQTALKNMLKEYASAPIEHRALMGKLLRGGM